MMRKMESVLSEGSVWREVNMGEICQIIARSSKYFFNKVIFFLETVF